MTSTRGGALPSSRRGPIIHVITDLELGGTELMLARLLRNSASKDQLVVSLGGRGAVAPKVEQAGIQVIPLHVRSGRGVFTGLPRLVRLIRRHRPAVVQGWLAHGNLVATAAHRLAGGRSALLWNIRQSLSDIRLEKPATRAVIRLNARLSGRPDSILYNSEAGAQQHEAIGYRSDKRRIVPNGFDLEWNSPDAARRMATRKMLGVGTDEILIGLVGRLHPTKNHRGFLRAASLVLDAEPSARFLCAGVGATLANSAFDDLVTDPRLRQRGLFLGPRDDVADLTRALDIASNVSIGEGFSNAIGEAMACGVPCVATNSGDSHAIIADTGLLTESSSPESIAAALLEMIKRGSDGREKLGVAARRRMEQCFSLSAMVHRYEEIYAEAALSRSPECYA